MLKKVLALFLALMMVWGVAAALAENTQLGGWIVLEDEGSDEIEERAEAALRKALTELVGANYEEKEVLAYQIVSGTNYCILCRVTPVVPNAVSHWALVYVYEALDGSCKILAVDDLELGIPGEAD